MTVFCQILIILEELRFSGTSIKKSEMEKIAKCRQHVLNLLASITPNGKAFADGVFVGPHAVVNARAQVGRGVIVNSGSILEHDVVVGEFAHLAPGSIATGEVHIANDVMVGAGAVILPRLSVSRGSVIGAGSVVVNDVNEGVTVAGNPAAEIR